MAAPFVAPNFNPLHREGGDRYILRTQSGQPRFQSTPPRGWRHQFIIDWIAANEFQSTPPRGWRPYTCAYTRARIDFNPLHREGGDTIVPPVTGVLCPYFNPLHREGGDHAPGGKGYGHPISIHSTARVETRAAALPVIHAYDFNPLHREGGDYTQ